MIDLCVVNYNTKNLLKRFLDSLHGDLNDSCNIWSLYLSDNGSSDGSWAWVDQNKSSYKIAAGWNNQNIGYSLACNGMAGYGSGDIIGLLNADVWLTTNDCINIQRIFDKNQDIHIFGPKQRDENGFITHAGIVGTNLTPVHRGWKQYDPNDVLFKDRVSCVTVSGAAYFVRRSVWNALTYDIEYQKIHPGVLGAFLPTPHYYEETWCSYFARHRGYNVVYDGSISIGHTWHASSPKPGEGYSHADTYFKTSQEIFRKTCDYLGIERD